MYEIDVYGEYGILPEDQSLYASKNDKATSTMLKKAALENDAIDTMSWPSISTNPVCEYQQHSSIFSLAFPWLFPGGVGDFYDNHGEIKSQQTNGNKICYCISMEDLHVTKYFVFLL